MSTDEGSEHREVEHREGSKTEMGKARLSGDEVALIDRVRGDIGRGVWLRDVALRFAATSPRVKSHTSEFNEPSPPASCLSLRSSCGPPTPILLP